MIRYSLICEKTHEFEGWFRNSGDFDAQMGRSLVSCPVCNSTDVSKRLMAPAVATSRKREVTGDQVVAPPTRDAMVSEPASQSTSNGANALAPVDGRHLEVIEKIRELKQELLKNSDDVGKGFAEEARKIHYGEAEVRNIHGETSGEEAKALLDEGISVLPLPVLPEESN